MEDFKLRMFTELSELQDRIANLEEFIVSTEFKTLSLKMRFGLRMQLFYMHRYNFWLSSRINWVSSVEDIEEYNSMIITANAEQTTEPKVEKKAKTKRKTKKNNKHE